MKESEVKEYLFNKFLEWMTGQTVGVNEDGSDDYYDYDVERYAR
jgi:hypothetical protein